MMNMFYLGILYMIRPTDPVSDIVVCLFFRNYTYSNLECTRFHWYLSLTFSNCAREQNRDEICPRLRDNSAEHVYYVQHLRSRNDGILNRIYYIALWPHIQFVISVVCPGS